MRACVCASEGSTMSDGKYCIACCGRSRYFDVFDALCWILRYSGVRWEGVEVGRNVICVTFVSGHLTGCWIVETLCRQMGGAWDRFEIGMVIMSCLGFFSPIWSSDCFVVQGLAIMLVLVDQMMSVSDFRRMDN